MIAIDGVEVVFEKYPNGEARPVFPFVRGESHWVSFRYEEDGDLIKLMLVKKHLDRIRKYCCYSLMVQYMPYSRMDRVESAKDCFSLKYISEFINGLGFDKVLVNEAHSDVTLALLNNVTNASITKMLFINHRFSEEAIICFPDAGSAKKYSKVSGNDWVLAHKVRDFATGKIESIKVFEKEKVLGKEVVILDDLCSYGGTFLGTAKILKEAGAVKVTLIVAHCEKSILSGKIPTSDLIDEVITTNSIISKEDAKGVDKITVVEV